MSAIIFDFDGTIADSFDYVIELLAAKAKRQLTDEERKAFRSASMINIGRELGLSWRKLFQVFLSGRQEMSGHIHKVKPFEGVPEVIKKLHAEGHQLFIVTSNTVHSVHTFLHHYKLNEYFFEIDGNIGFFGKAPALRRMLRANHIERKDAVYVGDEMRDVEAAQSLKLRSVAVSWGFARLEDLQKLKPTKLAHSPAELLSVLEEI